MLCKSEEQFSFRITQLRYVLYYTDDLVSDSFKIKSMIKNTTAQNEYFNMQLLTDPDFQKQVRQQGSFFDINVSPVGRNKYQQDNRCKTFKCLV